jgi:DNA-binding MarR family transcriptional regulator
MNSSQIVRHPHDETPKTTGQHGRSATRLARQIELSLLTAGLSVSQYRFLACLDEGTKEPSAMADSLVVTRPSVTAVADVLVTRGLVERQHADDDRRRVTHTLTTAGSEILAAADAAVEDRLDRILSYLADDSERGRTLDSLDLWRRALDGDRAVRRAGRA